MKIGIIKEGKNPPDFRVPLTPDDCLVIQEKYPNIQIKVQNSNTRSYKDEEYQQLGIDIKEDISDCDIFLGVKEVPIADLIPGKTYFFFSHTIKEQPYNQKLIKALLEKNITMIDYETLVDENGNRIIGFGFYAGIVGTHNALLTYGKKFKKYELKAAHECKDLAEMTSQYSQIEFPNFKIAVTGSGRVARGIWEIMHKAGISEVTIDEYLNQEFDTAVWVRLLPKDLYIHKETKDYNREIFHTHPNEFECQFHKFLSSTDILINGIFWEENIDRLFEKDDAQKNDFNISVIADVTCDIYGSVPINIEASTIKDPVYGLDKSNVQKTEPFQDNKAIVDMMTIDNLPNELPRDASAHFGDKVIEVIIPELLKDHSEILERATICKNGQLSKHYQYLTEYAFGPLIN